MIKFFALAAAVNLVSLHAPAEQPKNLTLAWQPISKLDKRLPSQVLKGRKYTAFEFDRAQLSQFIANMPRLKVSPDKLSGGALADLPSVSLPGPDGKPLKAKVGRQHREWGTASKSFAFFSFPMNVDGNGTAPSLMGHASDSTGTGMWAGVFNVPIEIKRGIVVRWSEIVLSSDSNVGFSVECVPNPGGE